MATLEQEVRALKVLVKALLDYIDRANQSKFSRPSEDIFGMASVLDAPAGESEVAEILGKWASDRSNMVQLYEP